MLEYLWSWINNGGSKDCDVKATSCLISETLLEELIGCIKEIEIHQREKESQRKREAGTPDYTWLMNESVKQYKMPQFLKTEIEDLCVQIEQDVAPLVINDFRRVVNQDTPVDQIPYCFKSVLNRQLIIQNLKAEPKDNRRTNKTQRDSNGFFKRRLQVPHLREKDLEAWGNAEDGTTEARVNSAPASSWRFFRQSRIQPTAAQVDFVQRNDNQETRRANSVPTITTTV